MAKKKKFKFGEIINEVYISNGHFRAGESGVPTGRALTRG
jgi:hypothetical protein